MSVVGSAQLLHAQGGVGEGFERTYQRQYLVRTDARSDDVTTVLAAPGLPAYRSAYPFDGGAYAIGIEAVVRDPNASLKVWDVTVNYSSKPADEEEETPTDDPLLKPVVWSGSFVQFQEPVDKDKDNKPVANRAGDAFVNPPAMRDVSYPTITATKNYASLDLSVWAKYADAVNSDTFLGLEPRKVRVRSITWKEQFRGSATPYYPVTFTFLVRDIDYDDGLGNTGKGHDFFILNQGFREKTAAGQEPTKILDDGLPLTDAAMLSTEGKRLTQIQIPAQVNYVPARVYKELPFAALGLPFTTDK